VTTPNQQKPDYGLQWIDLSYEIGGGAYNYGQELDSDVVKWLIYGPMATLENLWEFLEHNLLKQPLEVLQTWEPFIPFKFLDPDFSDVPTAVATILEFFAGIKKLLSVEQWEQWLQDVFGPFYDSTVAFIEDTVQWLEDVFTPFYDLTVKFIEDMLLWLEEVFKPLEALIPIIEALATDAWELSTGILDNLMRGFHGWSKEVGGFVAEDLQQLGVAIGTGLGELNHVAMRVAKLEAEIVGEAVEALENFATYGENALGLAGDLWEQVYTGVGGGTLGTQQGYAVFQTAVDTVDKVAVAVAKEVMQTDFQKVSAVISKPITDAAASANTILARVDNTVSTAPDHVFAKMTDAVATIGFVKNGVTTVLGTVNNLLKNGSTYTLEAGVGDAVNTFRLVENSKEILKVTDASGLAPAGANNRRAGFGAIAPNQKARPGVVAAFAAFTR
jgi:hypothetical protein